MRERTVAIAQTRLSSRSRRTNLAAPSLNASRATFAALSPVTGRQRARCCTSLSRCMMKAEMLTRLVNHVHTYQPPFTVHTFFTSSYASWSFSRRYNSWQIRRESRARGWWKRSRYLVPMQLQILEANRNENTAEAAGPHSIVIDSRYMEVLRVDYSSPRQ